MLRAKLSVFSPKCRMVPASCQFSQKSMAKLLVRNTGFTVRGIISSKGTSW